MGALTHDQRVGVDLDSVRIAGGAMLAAAIVWPLHPHALDTACVFHAVTGVPCPLCGMTRSVTATMHLHLRDALAFNPAGIVVVLVAIALLLVPRRGHVAGPRWLVPVAIALLWACQLLRLPFT